MIIVEPDKVPHCYPTEYNFKNNEIAIFYQATLKFEMDSLEIPLDIYV